LQDVITYAADGESGVCRDGFAERGVIAGEDGARRISVLLADDGVAWARRSG